MPCIFLPGARGSSSLRKISEYYEHAGECRQLSKLAGNADHAAMLENMAETWENLAKEREEHLARQARIASLEENGLPYRA